MRKRFILAVFLVVAAAAPSLAGGAAISNLKSGKICDPRGLGDVCKPGPDVLADDSGQCLYDGKPFACTWYGFSFDYAPADLPALECDWSSDHRSDIGNPQSERARDVMTDHYTMDLRSDHGHHVQAQYSVKVEAFTVEEIKQSCSYQGRKLFDVTLRLHFGRTGS